MKRVLFSHFCSGTQLPFVLRQQGSPIIIPISCRNRLTRYTFAIEYAAMSILQRAIQVVADAEASLRRMIVEAAEKGDYGTVETLARWASNLGDFCSEQTKIGAIPSEPTVKSATSFPEIPGTVAKPKSPKPPGRRRSYPYFARSGDTLIKFAWSKSSKSEYQHKSSRFILMQLAEAMARQAKGGAVVSMEKVLPLKLDDGSEVPDYQVYVSLAWMRQVGAVKQNGRQGYTINRPNELAKIVESAWAELPDGKSS